MDFLMPLHRIILVALPNTCGKRLFQAVFITPGRILKGHHSIGESYVI